MSVTRHEMPFGARCDGGATHFRLWAPGESRVSIEIDGEPRSRALRASGDGWHELTVAKAGAGTLYRYVLADGMRVPDPAARFQPQDVHGPSEVIDACAYEWADDGWRGRPWQEAVVYELHVGGFSPQGGYDGVRARLPELAALGITAIELMPLADVPGRRNWGYDGVLPFAPDASYGRPEELKALVDAAHARGLMVLLDVVYNHFGPEGNYAPRYWPQLLTEHHHTPWGAAVNLDDAGSAAVRELIIHNALYWLEEYHFDGLRLDAVHALRDDGPRHLLDELAARVHDAFAGRRSVHLVLENEENDARRLAPAGPFTAQWNDDVHHGLHAAVTGEDQGYYAEYRADPTRLARALAEGFAWQGELMSYRGSPRGTPSGALSPTAFVSFLQNHDQVGNRAFGERITALAPPSAVRAAAAVYLLAPQVPMLFMGEEWAASSPFLFFCDFSGDLRDQVRDGRRAEFARFPAFAGEATRARIPDPTDPGTFDASRLRWEERAREPHAAWLQWYTRILEARRTHVVPLLPHIGAAAGSWIAQGAAMNVRWRAGNEVLRVLANLQEHENRLPDELAEGLSRSRAREIWREGEADTAIGRLGPWSVLWLLEPAP